MSPLTGSDGSVVLVFSQRWWKWTVVPEVVQSTAVSVGLRGPQSQVFAHTSMMPGRPSHRNWTVKQHVVASGVPAGAETQIIPIQPGGTGFGAGVLSGLTSVALHPGHSPAMLHDAPTA